MQSIIFLSIILMCLKLPIILTIFNILNLFNKKKIAENVIDILTFVLGITLTAILYWFIGFKDYNEPLYLHSIDPEWHAPIASCSMPTAIAIVIVGIISYFLIRVKKLNLPPIIIITSMSGVFICGLFMLVFVIQLSKNILDVVTPYLALFPINYILCSIRAIIEVMQHYKERNNEQREYNNKVLNKCNKILNNINNWPIIAIILILPLGAILICILTLFGQRPDEAIRAFLETSDWTLSTKVSPPPIEYDGHYLCTVSLKGHKDLVRPTRMGIRHGERIVVNRQLCIANAFEDLIQEKIPKFHHFIRYIYDKYGFPLAKHIKTEWQAI